MNWTCWNPRLSIKQHKCSSRAFFFLPYNTSKSSQRKWWKWIFGVFWAFERNLCELNILHLLLFQLAHLFCHLTIFQSWMNSRFNWSPWWADRVPIFSQTYAFFHYSNEGGLLLNVFFRKCSVYLYLFTLCSIFIR